MTARATRLEELFSLAATLAVEERRAFLDARCADDDSLRQEVEELLRLDDTMPEEYLQPPVTSAPHPIGAQPGDLVAGRYRLVRELGEGGMGVVFAADQIEPIQRRVAIKLLKAGLDTRQVIKRFQSERQSLAMMDHPNIARVLDAGATREGRPFFVMEHIEGESITAYCALRSLGLRARLELFLQVCQGVQHAHTKGVIHRDLKPSNIIVSLADGAGAPRVIDFGIAKAIGAGDPPDQGVTSHARMLGTPEYMSPEQAIADPDIDTRADVYSLGAVLYELLTGRPPFESETRRARGVLELERIIRTVEPMRPSLRAAQCRSEEAEPHLQGPRSCPPRALRGDLDRIVLKAMEKDRARRYETVSAFAEDIRRHLRNEPVEAAAPSMFVRLWKFTRRNRRLVIGASVVIVTVLTATAFSVALAVRESVARRQAAEVATQARAAQARAETVRSFLEQMLLSARAASAHGDNVTVREILISATDRIDRGILNGQPDVEFEVRQTIGKTFLDMGWAELAIPHLSWARTYALARFGPDDLRTLELSALWGESIKEGGDPNEALETFQELHGRAARGLGQDHPLTLESLGQVGNTLARLRRPAEALPVLLEASEGIRRVHGQHSDQYALTQFNIAGAYRMLRRPAEAEPYYLRAIDTFEREGSPASVASAIRARSELALTIYPALGRDEEAERLMLDTADLSARRLGPEHGETVRHMTAMADFYWRRGRLVEARRWIDRRASLLSKLYPADSWARLSTRQRQIGIALALGDNEWVEQETRSILNDLTTTQDPHVKARTVWDLTRGQWLEVWTRAALTQSLLNTDRVGEAHAEALRLVDRVHELDLQSAGSFWSGESDRLLLLTQVLRGDASAEIAADLRTIYEDFKRTRGAGDALTARAADTLGVCLTKIARPDEGERLFAEAEPVISRYFGSKNLPHAPSSLGMTER